MSERGGIRSCTANKLSSYVLQFIEASEAEMTNAPLQLRRRAWRLPATFVVTGLSAGLLVDAFQAWALNGTAEDCHPQFTVLYFSNPHFGVSPTRVDEQAIVAWELQVAKKYGQAYAKFAHAQSAHTGIRQCYPELDGSPDLCGFVSGQPCRRINVTEAPRLFAPRSDQPSAEEKNAHDIE